MKFIIFEIFSEKLQKQSVYLSGEVLTPEIN